jgi:hypothetical protein
MGGLKFVFFLKNSGSMRVASVIVACTCVYGLLVGMSMRLNGRMEICALGVDLSSLTCQP